MGKVLIFDDSFEHEVGLKCVQNCSDLQPSARFASRGAALPCGPTRRKDAGFL